MVINEIRALERDLAGQGLTPDEIADAVAAGASGNAMDRSGLIDAFLGEDTAAERRRRLREQLPSDDDEDTESDDDADD